MGAGAGGSIQVFVTDGFGLLGAFRTWTDVGRPNVQAAPARLDTPLFRPMEAAGCRSTHRLRPRPNRGGMMPSKLRRTRTTLQAKAYRSAVAVAGLLVLLEALGAPRKL